MISKKERVAVLQILAIKEGLTSAEFSNVLNEVAKISIDSIFTTVFHKSSDSIVDKSNNTVKTQPKNIDEILRRLKISDPEKYQLLYELRINIRSGLVMKNFSDVKDFLARIDQIGLVSNSKSSTVNKLLIYLSKKNTTELRDLIKNKIRVATNNDDKGFNELANYIIDPNKK